MPGTGDGSSSRQAEDLAGPEGRLPIPLIDGYRNRPLFRPENER